MRDIVLGSAATAAVAILILGCTEAPERPGELVVYSSVDEVFARPIAGQF